MIKPLKQEDIDRSKTLKELIDITARVCNAATHLDPDAFNKFFVTGLIMNVMGNMSDTYWEEFSDIPHCDDPDCIGCKATVIIMPALKALRQQFRDMMSSNKDVAGMAAIDLDWKDMLKSITQGNPTTNENGKDNPSQSFSM